MIFLIFYIIIGIIIESILYITDDTTSWGGIVIFLWPVMLFLIIVLGILYLPSLIGNILKEFIIQIKKDLKK